MAHSKGLAMDLGTANTLIHKQGEGIVLNEPSVVAVNENSGKIIAVGSTAKSYIGRTPENIRTVRPLKDGVITDYEIAQKMIGVYLKKVSRSGFFTKPPIIICVPGETTQVEKRAVVDAAKQSGAGRVYLMEETMAAAIGAGLDVSTPEGKLVMDVGGGTSEVSLISMSVTVIRESIPIAGYEFDQAIMKFIRDNYDLDVGENHAEQIKMAIGTAMPPAQHLTLEIHGKDRTNGTLRKVVLHDAEIRDALIEPVKAIEDLLRKVMSALPPEFINDIGQGDVLLAGGGALLSGLAERLSSVSSLKIAPDKEPLLTVVRGAGIVLDNLSHYKKVLTSL